MEKSKAILLGVSEGGEMISSAAGRISTQQGTAMDIFEKSKDPKKNASLIKKVTRSGHNSVVEHTFFNFAFCDVSVVVEQFMIEFRLASFTVKSRRYVDFSDAGYYVPEFKNSENEKIYRNHMDALFSEYASLLDAGIPKEDARFILPYCFRSNFFCSLNARELLNVLRAMFFGRGSKFPEIYNLGKQIIEQVSPVCPGIFEGFEEKTYNINDETDLSDFCTDVGNIKSEELTEIVAYTKDAGKVIAKTALMSGAGVSAAAAEKIVSSDKNVSDIIGRVMKSSRPRSLEAAQFTVRFNAISLSSITHLVRHRMQSIIVPPLTKVDRNSFIIPESVKADENALSLYKTAFERNAGIYESLKNSGENEETLIYIIMSGNTLDVVSTMNCREYMTFFKLRTCTRAQWEIRDYAEDALFKLRKISPEVFCHYGPSCYMDRRCPEGALSCGRIKEMQEKFKP